jgi:hypothetical protein
LDEILDEPVMLGRVDFGQGITAQCHEQREMSIHIGGRAQNLYELVRGLAAIPTAVHELRERLRVVLELKHGNFFPRPQSEAS